MFVNGSGNIFEEGTAEYDGYSLLNPGFEKDYELLSHLILKQILLDQEFQQSFLSFLAGQPKERVQGFIAARGSYADWMLEKGQCERFMATFERFWDRTKDEYLLFFQENIFPGTKNCIITG